MCDAGAGAETAAPAAWQAGEFVRACAALRLHAVHQPAPQPAAACLQGHWGAFGGDQTVADVGSGLGVVHNTYLFDQPQKAVVRTPFISPLHPLPAKYSAVPLGVAKAVVGLINGGVRGVLKMLLWVEK